MTDVAAFIKDRLREQTALARAANATFTTDNEPDGVLQRWAWGRRTDGAIAVRHKDDPRGELEQTPVTQLIDTFGPNEVFTMANVLHSVAETANDQQLMSLAFLWSEHPDFPFDANAHHHAPNQKPMDGSD
jgi:hypothetical protein